MKTIIQLVLTRPLAAGLLAITMLFAFVNNAYALWPAGIYRFDAIKGTVLDKETRKPIEGVVVVGHWGLQTNQIMSSSYSGPLVVKETITDKDGKFTIPASVATDIHKRGHFNAEKYPEIAFFKSGYDFTVYRHSAIEPMSGNPVTYNTVTGDDYLMSKWRPGRTALIEKLAHAFSPLELLDTFIPGFCPNYEIVTPRLLSALRLERDRIAKADAELADYFAYAYSLRSMESCISNHKQNGKSP